MKPLLLVCYHSLVNNLQSNNKRLLYVLNLRHRVKLLVVIHSSWPTPLFLLLLCCVMQLTTAPMCHAEVRKETLYDFINKPDKYSVVITISNYAPVYAFKDNSALKNALKDPNVMAKLKACQVSQCKIVADFAKTNIYYSEQTVNSHDVAAFTNRTGRIIGKQGQTWWNAQLKGIQVLESSERGQWFDVSSGKTNNFFANIYEDCIRYFKLGVGEVSRGTFTLSDGTSPSSYSWKAKKIDGTMMSGTASFDGNTVYLRLSADQKAKWKYVKLSWSGENNIPDSIEVFRGDETNSADRLILSYHLRQIIKPDEVGESIFQYASHTNFHDAIVFINKDNGKRVVQQPGGKLAPVKLSGDYYASGNSTLRRKISVWIVLLGCSGALFFGVVLTKRKKKK